MLKFFIKTLFLCFGVLYALVSLGKSLGVSDVRFEEYYVNRYAVGLFTVESTGVHGSGSDLDGYYANVFYGKDKLLPIRFTDFDPQSQVELDLFLLGFIVALSSCIPFAVWVYKGWSTSDKLPKASIVLVSVGVGLVLLSFIPVISFGKHYVNVFVPG
jgi:hypothetical protein